MRIAGSVGKVAKRKGWTEAKRQAVIESIVVTCDDADLAHVDLVVEAIVERMDVKQSLFRGLAKLTSKDAILATNTSSLSVDEMAESTAHKENFGGLHFFNPVHRMELVEVVHGKHTSEETIARLVSFVRALGKTPIVTADSPGFLVNRVLFPYLGEAVLMVREGCDIAGIDKQLKRFGMPMGPLELLDQVGIDVAHHVASSLSSILPGVQPVAETLGRMVEAGRLGKKSGTGFYEYSKGRKGKPVPSADRERPQPLTDAAGDFPDDGLTPIQRRLVYPMLTESIRCLEEGVVAEPWAIDLGMVLGTGFAPHRGGPLHVVDQIGAHRLLSNAKRLAAMCGPRFTPPERLLQMAAADGKFFAESAAIQTEGNTVSQ
jgi:3-hydroxyacyl-CoA dehydrogenase/enoyl-CoA hydratase/3-hydroxybutyryl-CoA epimerase